MNRGQRATLLIVLALDVLLILYPPFERRAGWQTLRVDYDWLPSRLFNASISFPCLAAEIVIVSVIGFTIFVLAQGTSEKRVAGAIAASIESIMRQIRRGLFRLWVIGTVVFEVWFAWDGVGELRHDPSFTGWAAIGFVAGLAILPPLAVLVFGRALLWAAAGFRTE